VRYESLGPRQRAELERAKAKAEVVRALHRLEIANSRRELATAEVRKEVEAKLQKLNRAEEEVRRLARGS